MLISSVTSRHVTSPPARTGPWQASHVISTCSSLCVRAVPSPMRSVWTWQSMQAMPAAWWTSGAAWANGAPFFTSTSPWYESAIRSLPLWQPRQRSSVTLESTGGWRLGFVVEPSRDVAGRAPRAVAVDQVVAIRAPRPEVAARAEFPEVSLCGRRSRGSEDLRHRLDSRPATGFPRTRTGRRRPCPRSASSGDVATRAASRAWQPSRPHVRATVERAPGSFSRPSCARSLPNASGFPRWQDAQPSAARAWAPPGSSDAFAWQVTHRSTRPPARSGPRPSSAARRASRLKAVRRPSSAAQTAATKANVRNIRPYRAASKTRTVKNA